MTYSELWHKLTPLYDQQEAVAIVRALLDELFGFTLTDIVMGKVETLSGEQQQTVERMMQRLESGEPLQYVVGYTTFCGRRFHVTPAVLIPRPETEELCRMPVADYDRPFCGLQPPAPTRILDIGTGSGCIAITLALDLPNSDVTAWDISSDALLVARDNAHRLGAKVNFEWHDILSDNQPVANEAEKYDIIVSNPPYVCDNERSGMRRNVLEHEPSLALFVPDDDPLKFYRAIVGLAQGALRKQGNLYFEVNSAYADDVADLCKQSGFASAKVVKDQFGNKRFVRC